MPCVSGSLVWVTSCRVASAMLSMRGPPWHIRATRAIGSSGGSSLSCTFDRHVVVVVGCFAQQHRDMCRFPLGIGAVGPHEALCKGSAALCLCSEVVFA